MNDAAALDQLCQVIAGRLGLARQHLRLEKVDRLAQSGMASVLLHEPDLAAEAWQTVVSAVTIPETRFLRQRGWFRQMELLALTPLIKQRREGGERRLRIWSAGCATGEEAYTAAMLLRDLLPDIDGWHVEILATDINAAALRDAADGCYAARQLRELDPAQVVRHFTPAESGRWLVRPEVRSLVRFQVTNLIDDAAYPLLAGAFDLIICRNVLMYLGPEMQRRVASNLCASLRDDGWLAAAPAEAIVDWFRPLTPINAPEAILFHKNRQGRSRAAPRRAETPCDTVPARLPTLECDHADVVQPELPSSPRPTLDDIRRFADRGALDQARTHCNELIARDRFNGAAYLLLSAICGELGDYPTAHDAARRAIYLEPGSAQAHFQLAGVLRNLGQVNRADRSLAIAGRLATRTTVEAIDGASDDRNA